MPKQGHYLDKDGKRVPITSIAFFQQNSITYSVNYSEATCGFEIREVFLIDPISNTLSNATY